MNAPVRLRELMASDKIEFFFVSFVPFVLNSERSSLNIVRIVRIRHH